MSIHPDPSGIGFIVAEAGVEPVYFDNAHEAYDYYAGRLSQEEQEYYRERYRRRELRRLPDGGLLTPHLAAEN